MEVRKVTISTHNGSSYCRNHNARVESVVSKEPHIDPNGHYEIWLDEEPKEAYERIFGKALKEYNDKQTRESRKIKCYYDQVVNDSKKNAVYEMIIGIYGHKEDGTPICSFQEQKDILFEFFNTWSERNPNLELIGCYLHADEEGFKKTGCCHCHLNYIPVAHGYKRGLETQNGLDKALQQMNFVSEGKKITAQIKWEASENQYLGSLCNKYGLLVSHPTKEKQEHLDTATFKSQKTVEELNRQAELLKKDLESMQQDLNAAEAKRDTLKAQNSLIETVKDAYAEADRRVQVLSRSEEKKAPNGEIKRPATVTISEEDYEYLEGRACSARFLENALRRLQNLGNKLMREVNINKQIQSLKEDVMDLEAKILEERRLAESNYIFANDLKTWMLNKFIKGYSIWDYFTHERLQQENDYQYQQESRELE